MFQISFRIVGLNWQMKDQDLTIANLRGQNRGHSVWLVIIRIVKKFMELKGILQCFDRM